MIAAHFLSRRRGGLTDFHFSLSFDITDSVRKITTKNSLLQHRGLVSLVSKCDSVTAVNTEKNIQEKGLGESGCFYGDTILKNNNNNKIKVADSSMPPKLWQLCRLPGGGQNRLCSVQHLSSALAEH